MERTERPEQPTFAKENRESHGTAVGTSLEQITLKHGFMVSLDALRVAWHLEEAGFDMQVVEQDVFEVQPANRLTPEDAAAVEQHQAELIALSEYVEAM